MISTSRLRGHLPILGNKNRDVHLGGKGDQKGRKSRISFLPRYWPTLLFDASLALHKEFEIFDNFDHIFTILLSLFRPLIVGMTPLRRKLELSMKAFDQTNRANFRHLMSHRGVTICPKICSSLWSQLSFKSLKLAQSQPVVRKSTL